MLPMFGRLPFVFGLLAFGMLGCGRSAPAPSELKEPNSCVIGVSLTRIDEPWREQIKSDIEIEAAKYPNVQLDFRIADNDAAKQQAQLEELCQSGVKAIILRPVEAAALTAPVAKIVEAGIPVVVLERPLVGDRYTCLIVADFKKIGKTAGDWLAEHLQGKGTIAEIRGPVDSLPDEELHAGFRAALRDPGYRFTNTGCVDPPKVNAANLMADALEQAEEIDAVFAFNDAAAHAAYQTAKAAGRQQGTLFLGVGGMPIEGSVYVDEGILDASFLLPTGGAEAVDIVMKALHGEKVPKTITLKTRVLTKKDR